MGKAEVADDFHRLQERLESALLDLYQGGLPPARGEELNQAWQAVARDLDDPAARALADFRFPAAPPAPAEVLAAAIGEGRSRLEHIAALEALANQRAGRVEAARVWRDFATLPQFANADAGGLLLQMPAGKVREPGVTQALAKEYVEWQATRTRQLFDRFQRSLARSEVPPAFPAANLAEIRALADFPPSLIDAAGIARAARPPADRPVLAAPYAGPAAQAALAAWRENVENALPNLLSAADVARLERLLARFVELVPKEYRSGVQDGKVIIPLEVREASQFTEQAQGLVGELSPVWKRDKAEAYARYHQELLDTLARLQKQIDHTDSLDAIAATAHQASSLLEGRFGLSARKAGSGVQVVDETVLEVRSSLTGSLAAAQAGHWQEAESLRLDAYTSFDSEIEIRVLPRNPELARKAERSFIDGQGEEPGIKALLDRRAPIEELTQGYQRALNNMEECAAVLKVAVSPATIGFTAFTIIGREGMEAIIILAALLAGLRGPEQAETRRWIGGGALLGVALSLVTFWLSQTIVRSLMRYGENLEAVVSVLAVIVLLMVTNWVFHKVYWVGWNTKLRTFSKSAQKVRTARWEVVALLGVGFLTVYREGFETTVFMQSLLLEGGKGAVGLGVLAGFLFVGGVGAAIFLFGAKLPYRRLLVITGVLVVSIMVTFLGSTVRLFQTVGWLPVHPIPGLQIPSWAGLWLGLYPSWEGILIPPLALVYVGGAWLYLKLTSGAGPEETAPAPGVAAAPRPPAHAPLAD
jgi:high-affinity iron transporter